MMTRKETIESAVAQAITMLESNPKVQNPALIAYYGEIIVATVVEAISQVDSEGRFDIYRHVFNRVYAAWSGRKAISLPGAYALPN